MDRPKAIVFCPTTQGSSQSSLLSPALTYQKGFYTVRTSSGTSSPLIVATTLSQSSTTLPQSATTSVLSASVGRNVLIKLPDSASTTVSTISTATMTTASANSIISTQSNCNIRSILADTPLPADIKSLRQELARVQSELKMCMHAHHMHDHRAKLVGRIYHCSPDELEISKKESKNLEEIIVRLNAKQDELISVMRTRLLGSLPPSATRPIHPKGMKRPRTSCNLPTVTTASIQPSFPSVTSQTDVAKATQFSSPSCTSSSSAEKDLVSFAKPVSHVTSEAAPTLPKVLSVEPQSSAPVTSATSASTSVTSSTSASAPVTSSTSASALVTSSTSASALVTSSTSASAPVTSSTSASTPVTSATSASAPVIAAPSSAQQPPLVTLPASTDAAVLVPESLSAQFSLQNVPCQPSSPTETQGPLGDPPLVNCQTSADSGESMCTAAEPMDYEVEHITSVCAAKPSPSKPHLFHKPVSISPLFYSTKNNLYSSVSSSHAAAVRRLTARQQPPDEETQEMMDFMLGLGLVPANIHSQLASRRAERRKFARARFDEMIDFNNRKPNDFLRSLTNPSKRPRRSTRSSPVPPIKRCRKERIRGGKVALSDDGGALHEDLCAVCEGAGELVMCDTCVLVYHLNCLRLRAVPDGKWSCPKCVELSKSPPRKRKATPTSLAVATSSSKNSTTALPSSASSSVVPAAGSAAAPVTTVHVAPALSDKQSVIGTVHQFVQQKSLKDDEHQQLLQRNTELINKSAEIQEELDRINSLATKMIQEKEVLVSDAAKASSLLNNMINIVKQLRRLSK